MQRFTPTEEENFDLYHSTFDFFKELSHFQIKGNPVYEHPLLKDQSDVLKLLSTPDVFQELSKIQPTPSLRINVLGQIGAGKTSVAQALAL